MEPTPAAEMTPQQAASTVESQLNKPPEDSKKWAAMMIGVKSVLVICLIMAVLAVVKPSIASQLIGMAQIAITSLAGLVGLFMGAQGAVEFGATASLSQYIGKQDDTVTVTEKRDSKDFEPNEVK